MKTFTLRFSQITTGITFAVILLSAVFVLPRLFGIAPYIVQSGSMEPVIHTGSVAFINHRDKDVHVGDIITYRLPSPAHDPEYTREHLPNHDPDQNSEHETEQNLSYGREDHSTLVTHRIIRIQDGHYMTKGDANETTDLSPVTQGQLVGTYICQIPYAGYLMAGMNRKTAIAAVVWILLLNGISMAMSWAAE